MKYTCIDASDHETVYYIIKDNITFVRITYDIVTFSIHLKTKAHNFKFIQNVSTINKSYNVAFTEALQIAEVILESETT